MSALDADGVLVGSDSKQEWLLPWWWENYRSNNTFPVSFVDLGMSEEARTWCKARGELLASERSCEIAAEKEKIDAKIARHWENIYGQEIWGQRDAWFKKPLSMLRSPYRRTLWLDLDCEVLRPLDELFSYCHCAAGFALAQEVSSSQMKERSQGLLLPEEILYNTGVVVYERGSPLLIKWAQQSKENSHEFWGDQQLLSRLIHNEQQGIRELPEIYNWRMTRGLNLSAAIVHWVGSWGKLYIKKHGGVRKELEMFFRSIDGLPRGDL